MVDEPGAIAMWVPSSIMFASTDATWLVVHKTAGFMRAQDCAAYFGNLAQNTSGVSSHYVVGQDGVIVQCVPEDQGAGANCCLTAGHAPYLPTGINLNVKTIAVEHIDPSLDNSTPLTAAQKQASFRLIQHICERHNIPKRSGDASGGIIGHGDIDPINRARCPGNYPWDELWAYLNGNTTQGGTNVGGTPTGWKDSNNILTAPNGIQVRDGFRSYILTHAWESGNIPLEPAHGLNPLELSNTSLGSGTRQTFRWITLEWTSKGGVFESWVGAELIATLALLRSVQSQVADRNKTIIARDAEIAQLKANPAGNTEQLQQQINALTTRITGMSNKLAQIDVILKAS